MKIFKFLKNKKLSSGQSLVELLVTMGLAALILPALLTGFFATRGGRAQAEQRTLAINLVREGQEAARVVREGNPETFFTTSENGTYHPAVSGNTWSLTSGGETTSGGFTRTITINSIYRDANGYIVDSSAPGATQDNSTKKITTTVGWSSPLATSIDATEYLTRKENAVYSQSGTVDPPAGGFGNWCKPTGPSITNVDLNRQGHPTSIYAFTTPSDGNRVLAGTGANSSGPAFTNVKITGTNPPTATILGIYNGAPQIKTNGLFGDLNFAYLGTATNVLSILDLNQFVSPPTNPPTYKSPIGSYTPNPAKPALSVFVSGTLAYATTQNTLYIIDITTKTSPKLKGSIGLPGGGGIKVVVVGSYAYVAVTGSNTKLQIINVSNPALPTLSGSLVNSTWADSRDISVNSGGTRVYLTTATSATKPEFFIIDVTNKANPTATGGTYDTGGMDPFGTALVTSGRVIIVGTGGHEYQVFIMTGDAISFCPNHGTVDNDFINIDSGVYAVSSILQEDGHAYSFIATGDKGAELKIVEGGAGSGGVGDGIFESSTFDAGHDVAFNYFSGTANANLSYKLAIKQTSGGVCPAFNDSDFVSISTGPIALPGVGYSNPGQCLRYRVTNSSVSTALPYAVTFNYSL